MDLKGIFYKKYKEFLEGRSIDARFIRIFTVFLAVFMICGILTRGSCIRSALFVDTHDVFMDFFNSVMYSADYPYHKYHVIYPPLITVFYSIIGFFTIFSLSPYFDSNSNMIEGNIAFQLRNSQQGLLFFFIISVILFFIIYELNARLISSKVKHPRGISLLIVCSFPLIYALERGNSILFLIPLVTLFLLWYDSDDKNRRYASFIVIGLAVSIKIYVVLFLLLFVHRRRIKDLVLCLVPILVLYFIPFLFTDGNAYNWFINSFGYTSSNTTISFINIRTMCNALAWILPDALCDGLYYLLLVVLYALSLVTILFAREVKTWKLFTLISCVICLGFGTGTTYYWVFFTICFIFFIREEKEVYRQNKPYFWLFMLIICWIPALFIRYIAYEIHAAAVLLLCLFLFRDLIQNLKIESPKINNNESTYTISNKVIVTFILALGLVTCSLATPLITEGNSMNVYNHGYNDMKKITDGERIEFLYDPYKNRIEIGETTLSWVELGNLTILSTDKGYLSDDVLVYLDSSNNKKVKMISGTVTGIIDGNDVSLKGNGWSAEWHYDHFGFLFSDNGDYTCFTNSLPDWRIFLENESQVYSVFYSDTADKLIAVTGDTSYFDGNETTEQVSYRIYDADAGFGSLKYIWNLDESVTVSCGSNTVSLPSYIVPIELHTIKDVPIKERNFIIVLIGAAIALIIIGTIILKSKRMP